MSSIAHSTLRHCYAYLNTTGWHRAVLLAVLAVLGIGFGVGFSVAMDDAKAEADADAAYRQQVFAKWQMAITSHFARAGSLAASVSAFVASHATEPMNFTAPAAARLKIIDDGAFHRTCADLFREVPGVLSLQMQSGGVISQAYPNGSAPIGLDIINQPIHRVVYDRLIETGLPYTVGPAPLAQGGVGIFIRYPIFTSSLKTRETFWGTGNVIIRVVDLLHSLNISTLVDAGMDYAFWYTTTYANGTVVRTTVTTNGGANAQLLVDAGARMELPISEQGKSSFLSMYPRNGIVDSNISSNIIITIVLVVLACACVIVLLMYTSLYLAFMFRQRLAPSAASATLSSDPKSATTKEIYTAIVTLRGAQSVVDNDPMEAVQIFNDFLTTVKTSAAAFRCYVVCEVGDRSVYVVSSSAKALAAFSHHVATTISILPTDCACSSPRSNVLGLASSVAVPANTNTKDGTTAGSQIKSNAQNTHRRRRASSVTSASKSQLDTFTKETGSQHSSRALISTVPCRASVGLHVADPPLRSYDAVRDAYFYGTTQNFSRLAAIVDSTSGGEVAWSAGFIKHGPTAADALTFLQSSASQVNTATENGNATCFIASFVNNTADASLGKDDDRSNEDPLMAMTVLNDIYVKKMTILINEKSQTYNGRSEKRAKGRNEKKSGHTVHDSTAEKLSSKESQESDGAVSAAAVVSRFATVLHIGIVNGEFARQTLDITRRIIAEERGVVVSAHERIFVAAFNLMSPGGHHQLCAAEAVRRLRSALPSVPFVCSIHHGRVNALVAEGLVMCTGDVVTVGRELLFRAADAAGIWSEPNFGGGNLNASSSAQSVPFVKTFVNDAFTPNCENPLSPKTTSPTAKISRIATNPRENELCFLFCESEVNTAFDCEAVDVVTMHTTTNLDRTAPGNSLAKTKKTSSIVVHDAVMSNKSDGEASPTFSSSSPRHHQPPRHRILYRLGEAKANVKNRGRNTVGIDDDEWMYQLQQKNSHTIFTIGNTIIGLIAEGNIALAAEKWAEVCERSGGVVAPTAVMNNGGTKQSFIGIEKEDSIGGASTHGYVTAAARENIERLLAAAVSVKPL